MNDKFVGMETIIYDDFNSRLKADQNVIGTLTTNIGSSAPRNGTKIIETDGEKNENSQADTKRMLALDGLFR